MAFNNLKGATDWTSTVQNSTGTLATSNFPLGKSIMLPPDQTSLTTRSDNKTFDQAIFAIELYGETWDFGPLEFTDVVIVRTPSFLAQTKSGPSQLDFTNSESLERRIKHKLLRISFSRQRKGPTNRGAQKHQRT